MTQVDPRFYDEILPRLWRGGKWGYYWSNDDGEGNKVTVWKNLEENSSPPVTPAWLGKMNCYYGIHPTKQRGESSWARAKIADIACINCLYAEIDGIESDEREAEWIHWLLNDCAVRPSLIIFSGGGLHVYWLLEDTFWLDSDENLERAIVAQKAIVARIGGDTSVHDLARVLRVAGTINHKPGRNSAVVTIRYWEPEETYFLEEIEQRIPEFIQDVQKKRALVTATSTQFESLGLDDQNVLRVMFGAKHGEEYRALWNGDTSCVDGDLSRADQKLLTGLAWATGCDASQMERLFRASSIAPTPEREKSKRSGYVTESISKAINTTTSVYNPAHNQDPMMIAAAESVMQNGNESHASSNESHASGNSEPSKPPPPNGAVTKQASHPLLRFGHNDEGNAQAFLSIFKGNYRYCSAYDGFLAYNGKYWVVDGADAMIQRAITDMLQQRHDLAQAFDLSTLKSAAKPNANNVRNCQFMLKAILETSFTLFDASPDHLNCANGVVDLRTGAIEAHSPDQLFTYCVPVDYDPHADYVHWVEFLGSVVSDFEIVEYLQMALGYSITGHTREECMFAIVGATRSGKGTLTETMLKVLPKPLGVEVDFSTFTARRDVDTQNFDLAALKPARFVAASESKQHETLNEAKVKLATGGNYIRAAFKHKDFFEYKPQFKILLTSNHQIKGDVNDDAFWGRLRIIEFPHSFLGREDKTLKARMQSPESLRGVLNWLIQGAIAWYAAPHGLPMPETIKDKTAEVRKDFDIIGQWLDECCDLSDVNAWTANPTIWKSFSEWCARLGLNRRGYDNIGTIAKALTPRGFDTSKLGYYRDGLINQRSRGVTGIKVL